MNKVTPVAVFLVAIIIGSSAWRYTHPAQLSEEGFSIVLTEDGSKVLSDADIRSYNASSHELILTDECTDRMKKNKLLTGDFVIVIDGEEDLRGVFVPPVVSRSYPSTTVVILYPTLMADYKTMKIQMGYPWDQPTSYDPRQNSRMIQHFDETGKLTR